MDNWKNIDKYGRYGDTMSKKIDGDIAHVNAVEYEMSPEYIKEHGSGTINPITGKREYFVDPISLTMAAVSLGSMAYKGYQNMQNRGDNIAGRQGAEQIRDEKLGFLETDIGIQQDTLRHDYSLGMDKARSAYDLGIEGANINLESAMGNITNQISGTGYDLQAGAQRLFQENVGVARKSGLAGSTQIDAMADPSAMINKYASATQQLIDTKALEKRRSSLNIRGIEDQFKFDKADLETRKRLGQESLDLSLARGEAGIEESYQQSLGAFGDENQSAWGAFVEGAFG